MGSGCAHLRPDGEGTTRVRDEDTGQEYFYTESHEETDETIAQAGGSAPFTTRHLLTLDAPLPPRPAPLSEALLRLRAALAGNVDPSFSDTSRADDAVSWRQLCSSDAAAAQAFVSGDDRRYPR